MLDHTEEPKKCSCPYCPGHGWSPLVQSAIDQERQLTLQEYMDTLTQTKPAPWPDLHK